MEKQEPSDVADDFGSPVHAASPNLDLCVERLAAEELARIHALLKAKSDRVAEQDWGEGLKLKTGSGGWRGPTTIETRGGCRGGGGSQFHWETCSKLKFVLSAACMCHVLRVWCVTADKSFVCVDPAHVRQRNLWIWRLHVFQVWTGGRGCAITALSGSTRG